MFRSVVFLSLLSAVCSVNATTPDLPRINGNVAIDGVLDEPAWRESLRVALEYENDPGENLPAPVSTIAYLAEDGENLYIAFDARDPDPDRIRAWLRDRDSFGPGDFVGVSFDTYADGRKAFEFFTNPLGVQLDKTHDDVNNRSDTSWDAIWESAGKIVKGGYVVEMRIPLNQLSFQDIDGKQAWGYRLLRRYPRDRDVSISNISKDRDRNCNLCQYPRFEGLDGSEPGKRLEIVPTLTASQSYTSDDPVLTPITSTGTDAESGVTVRYGITPEINANLAINPDFSQIEADGVQLDINNRFALSYPEKRPFFLRGADYFTTPLQAIFTRTVTNPEVAAKITGKSGAHTVASFAAQDEVTSLLFPRATGSDTTTLEQGNLTFVGRYSRSLADTSTLGGLLTVRDGADYRNLVGGVDTRLRFNDHHELVTQLLYTETEYPAAVALEFEQPAHKFTGDALFLLYSFDTRDWFSEVKYWQIDDTFRADVGFIKQAGSAQQEYSFGRKWQAADGWWTRLRLRGAYETTERADGQLLEDSYIVQFTLDGPRQSWLNLNMRRGREFDAGVVYDVERVNFATRVQPLSGLMVGLHTRFGDEVDYDNGRLAEQRRFNPWLNWDVNRNLLLRLQGTRVELETKTGTPIFDAEVVDARLTWQFNLRSYVRVTLQRADIDRNQDEYIDTVEGSTSDVGRQVMYSWKLNPQTVFFLGYSDAYVNNDRLESLAPSDRNWFMKVGYAWVL